MTKREIIRLLEVNEEIKEGDFYIVITYKKRVYDPIHKNNQIIGKKQWYYMRPVYRRETVYYEDEKLTVK